MAARCTNVECPSPAVRWHSGAWVHTDTGLRSCTTGSGGLVMPPLAQQHPRTPDQLFWRCPTCGTWAPVRAFQDGSGGAYARCYGPAGARHLPTTWTSSVDLSPPADTPPLPEPRNGAASAPAAEEPVWEYGIEYHYSPGRWHVLPNLVISDQEAAERELAKRRRGFGEGGTKAYRLLKRRAPGPWAQVNGA